MADVAPKIVAQAFPALSGLMFIKRLTSPIPMAPDTTFDIFSNRSGLYFALVTTDYPDPLDQGREFGRISEGFEFVDLLTPYDGSETIRIIEHDDMDRAFTVRDGRTYYYLANIGNLDRGNISA